MSYFSDVGIKPASILLPGDGICFEKWSVIACDQYTSQVEYWQDVEKIVGDSPSTLRLIHPECYVGRVEPDIPAIHSVMADYRKSILTNSFNGFSLVERETTRGKRLGLVAAFDLDRYEYYPGSKSLIRATEGTVVDRLPPRMKIRKDACLESPHVMLLIDDKKKSVIEPLYENREKLRPIYDFELMKGSGHIRGWAVENAEHLNHVLSSLVQLKSESGGFLYAVGDGNHSFAAAKACWQAIRDGLSDDERQNHPMRYAMAEIVNLYDDALVFEPIHRAIYGVTNGDLTLDFILYCRTKGMSVIPCSAEKAHLYLLDRPLRIENVNNPLPVAVVQDFLDAWTKNHPHTSVDYIHGLDSLNAIDAARMRLLPISKDNLFDYVREMGALPRKAFSMGEAQDKRFYLECRAI